MEGTTNVGPEELNREECSNSFIILAKEHKHRFETKMIYESEMKTCPKKIKKDDYIKEQPRVISDQCDIRPLSNTQERVVRIYETNSSILSARKQIYRLEPKMIYELERKTHPRKTQKDDYFEDCKKQPRVFCDRDNIQPRYDTQEEMVRADETNRK